MLTILSQPWPWFVAGPLIGLMVPILLLVGGRLFGVSASLRTACALVPAGRVPRTSFHWRPGDAWRLAFVAGIALGGFIGGTLLANPEPLALAASTQAALTELGVDISGGLLPATLFSWEALGTWRGIVFLVIGGFLVGFGTAWAGGCTSGHSISGLAAFQRASLVATLGFFAGGLLMTHLLFPVLLGGR